MSRRPRRWPSPAGRPATWDDLEDVPDDVIGEIVNGEIVVSPRPNPPHAHTAATLGMALGGPFHLGAGGPGGWIILFEPRIRFGEDIRVPDLAGWQRERWQGVRREGPIPVIPDWICEVLSRSTETEDRTTKMDTYRRAEVRHLWFLDPVSRTLEVYRLESGGWHLVQTVAEEQRVRAHPFDAVELDLSLLWGEFPDDEEA